MNKLVNCPKCSSYSITLVNLSEPIYIGGSRQSSGFYWVEEYKCNKCNNSFKLTSIPNKPLDI